MLCKFFILRSCNDTLNDSSEKNSALTKTNEVLKSFFLNLKLISHSESGVCFWYTGDEIFNSTTELMLCF